MAFFELKKQTIANYNKYPPSTNCDDLYNNFDVTVGKTDVEKLPNFVIGAQADKKLIKGYGSGVGVYQCFCKAQQAYAGSASLLKGDNICKMYFEDFLGGKALA